MIVKSRNKTVEDVTASLAMQKDQERVLANDNTESALSSLNNNELLIPPNLIYLLRTESFLLEDDSDYNLTLRPKTRKLKGKTSALTNRKTRSIIGFSKLHFCYINDFALLYQHMHKVLNIL